MSLLAYPAAARESDRPQAKLPFGEGKNKGRSLSKQIKSAKRPKQFEKIVQFHKDLKASAAFRTLFGPKVADAGLVASIPALDAQGRFLIKCTE